MNARNRLSSLDPQPPRRFSRLTEVSEVFPDSRLAILAFVAQTDDGCFLVWSELKAEQGEARQACSPVESFATLDEAQAARQTLISDLLLYAYPDVVA